MTNSPEVEGQEVPIGEQHLGELLDEEIDIFEPPKHIPSVKLIRTRNYTNVNKIAECDHLTVITLGGTRF